MLSIQRSREREEKWKKREEKEEKVVGKIESIRMSKVK